MANANKIVQHECWAQMRGAREAFSTCPFCTDGQNNKGKKDPDRMLVVCQDCTPVEFDGGISAKDSGSHGCTVCRKHVGEGKHISDLKCPKTGKYLCAACPKTARLALVLQSQYGIEPNRYVAQRGAKPNVVLDRPQKAAGAATIKVMGDHAETGERQLTAASHAAHQQITKLRLECDKLKANLTSARDEARRNGLAVAEEQAGGEETAAEAQADLAQRLENSLRANEESQGRNDAAAAEDDARAAEVAAAEVAAPAAAEEAAPAAEEEAQPAAEVAAPAAEEEEAQPAAEVAAPVAGGKRKGPKPFRIKKKAKAAAAAEAAAEVAAPAAELEDGEIAEVAAREVAEGEPADGAMEVEAQDVAEALAPEGEEGGAAAEGSPSGGSIVGSAPRDDSDSEDEQPLARRKGAASSSAPAKQGRKVVARGAKYSGGKGKGAGGKGKGAGGKGAGKRAAVVEDDDSSSEDERPAKKKPKAASSAPAKQSRRAMTAMPEDEVPESDDEQAAAGTPAAEVATPAPQVDENADLTLATGVLKGRMPAYKAWRRGGGTNAQWLTNEQQRVTEAAELELEKERKINNYDALTDELKNAHAATAKARKESELQFKEVQRVKEMQRRTKDAMEALMMWVIQTKGLDADEVFAVISPFESGDGAGSSADADAAQ